MKDGSLHTLTELSMLARMEVHRTCSLIQAAVCCLAEEQDILDESRYIIEEEDDNFPPNISLVEPCKVQLDRFYTVSAPRDPLWNQWKTALSST